MKKKKRTSPVGLFNKLMDAQGNKQAFDSNGVLRDKLVQHGPIAADVIIGQLNAHWQAHGTIRHEGPRCSGALFRLCNAVRVVAEPRHAVDIAQLAILPDISSYHDDSALIELLMAIKELGCPRVVMPYLHEIEKIMLQTRGSVGYPLIRMLE